MDKNYTEACPVMVPISLMMDTRFGNPLKSVQHDSEIGVQHAPKWVSNIIRNHCPSWAEICTHVYGIKDRLLSGDEFMVDYIGDWGSFLRCVDDENDLKLLRKHLKIGRPLGDDNYIKKLEKLTGRILRRQKPGPKPRIK